MSHLCASVAASQQNHWGSERTQGERQPKKESTCKETTAHFDHNAHFIFCSCHLDTIRRRQAVFLLSTWGLSKSYLKKHQQRHTSLTKCGRLFNVFFFLSIYKLQSLLFIVHISVLPVGTRQMSTQGPNPPIFFITVGISRGKNDLLHTHTVLIVPTADLEATWKNKSLRTSSTHWMSAIFFLHHAVPAFSIYRDVWWNEAFFFCLHSLCNMSFVCCSWVHVWFPLSNYFSPPQTCWILCIAPGVLTVAHSVYIPPHLSRDRLWLHW